MKKNTLYRSHLARAAKTNITAVPGNIMKTNGHTHTHTYGVYRHSHIISMRIYIYKFILTQYSGPRYWRCAKTQVRVSAENACRCVVDDTQ